MLPVPFMCICVMDISVTEGCVSYAMHLVDVITLQFHAVMKLIIEACC